MSDKAWKVMERKIAKLFNTNRILEKGIEAPDIETNIFIGECKYRAKIGFHRYFDQAKSYSKKAGKIPLLFTQEKGKSPLVTLELNSFIALCRGAGVLRDEEVD